MSIFIGDEPLNNIVVNSPSLRRNISFTLPDINITWAGNETRYASGMLTLGTGIDAVTRNCY